MRRYIARDVEVERERPLLLRAVEDRAVVDEAGAVEQHIDRAHLAREGQDGGSIGHVEPALAAPLDLGERRSHRCRWR